MGELPWDPVEAAATSIAVDAAAAEAVSALREAGVPSILLKGASFDRWLYDAEEPRMYGDVDLLVPSARREEAERGLSALGYGQRREELAPVHVRYAKLWVRPRDGMHVDLHRTLTGVDPEAVDAWEVLSRETEAAVVGGVEIDVLSPPARALHVALHAAVHGRDEPKTLMELDRALTRLPTETWRSAAALAERLGAEPTFGAGLRLLPAGAELAGRLGLTTQRTVEATMFARSVPHSSWFLNRLADTPGARAKAGLVARRILPEPAFMRAWYPLARRGPGGLALAYLYRQAILVRNLGPAAVAWWRARRAARGS